mmetsp:Transcript_20871/g.24751  ORF Transcript_20871/g.24751 Transcript_20871/m.24751 type:complete len:146 (+) Transcript_20871:59-496(+)
MSDDEGPRKGGKKGKGGGKGGGGGKGKERKGGSGGGKAGGLNVSRLQVLPKFLQEIHAKYRPSDDKKRGLKHAELQDKSSPLGNNDDDEYDFEDAQIVDSNLTEEEIRNYQMNCTIVQALSFIFITFIKAESLLLLGETSAIVAI